MHKEIKLSLIICTYQRPIPVCSLLDSVLQQTRIPDEILIVDASLTNATELALAEKKYNLPIKYIMVDDEHRGLTRQRNYGISLVSSDIDIVAFLDDDIVLEPEYFKLLLTPYKDKEIVGVGGYIINENKWQVYEQNKDYGISHYCYDGWVCKDSSRIILRKRLGLMSKTPPCVMGAFSNGRSVSGFPPSGEIYPAEYFMGGVASYRKSIFNHIRFSPYFEGYGLYEDLDFTLRASKLGKLVVHTGAQLHHYHDAGGRPNKYKYGKMVIRNGYYVWKIKYPKATFEGWWKFYAIAWLQTVIRYSNVITGPKRLEAITEAWGRTCGLFSLLFSKPKRVD